MTDRRNRTSRDGGWLVGGLLVVLCIGAVMFGFSPTLNPIDLLTGKGFEVVVPKVTGMTQVRALLAMESAGLEGTVRFGYSSATQRGLVMSQKPEGATTAPRGSKAEIIISRGASRVLVPDLVGKDEPAAMSALGDAGLEPQVNRVNDESAPKGTVFAQLPFAGTITSGGSRVLLTVSLGPAQRVVPDIARLPMEGALFLLGKAGFTLGPVTYADSTDVQVDAVVGTNPAAGTNLDRDAPVGIVISSGPPPVAVPDLVNQKQTDATRQLSDLGFVVGEITQMGLPGDPQDGLVLGQAPAAGTPLRPGDVVTLTVRRAAKPPPTTATTAPPLTAPPTTLAPPPAPAGPPAPGT